MSIENDKQIFDGNLNCDSGEYLGYIDGSIVKKGEMKKNATPQEVIILREKPEYKARKRQNQINLLGQKGGRPYVIGRLSRFSGESTIDWIGGKRSDGSCSTGRLQQTHAFPYLRRLSDKKNQYVFGEDPTREGGSDEVIKDITRDGKSVNDLMRKVSDYDDSTDGCWIGIDAPSPKEDGTKYTTAEAEANKIRPYWNLYTALDVVDWKYDNLGELLWLKTRGTSIDDTNPYAVPVVSQVTKLWQRGKVTIYTITPSKDGRKRDSVKEEEILFAAQIVPFVQCGDLSGEPISFDDLESINRTIMDLGSVDRASYFKRNYPQLVLPRSCLDDAICEMYGTDAAGLAAMIIGMNYPIALPDDTTVKPEYLMPDSSALQAGSERITTLKNEMFEVAGMAFQGESKQVASGESKAWDFQDVSAVMKQKAEMLQDVERKCVDMTKAFDPNFEEWQVTYNTDFDIGDFEAEIRAIVLAGNMPKPIEMDRYILKKLLSRFERVGSQTEQKALDVILAAIDQFNNSVVSMDDVGGDFGNE